MTAGEVVRMLADIVSKNGNLLLNVVQTPEGDLMLILYPFTNEEQRVRSWNIPPFAGDVQMVAACGRDADAGLLRESRWVRHAPGTGGAA